MFERFVDATAALAAVLFTASGVMLTYEVIARYFFIKPTIWAAELSQLSLIWGCLLAMAWALKANRHIAVDAVTSRLSRTIQRRVRLAAMLAVALFAVITAVYGWQIFLDSFERGRTTGSLLDLPQWIAELPVPLGFALLTVQAGLEIRKSWIGELPGGDGQHE